MKLVAILRIKNAKLTIRECFDKLSELVDEIVVVDNGSTDGTLGIYKKYPKVVIVKKTRGFDEGRDRNLVLTLARQRQPNWILWIDSDEIFEKVCTRKVLNGYMNGDANLVMFRMFNFWLSKENYRVDGKWLFYTARPQRPLFRNLPTVHFSDQKLHGGNVLGITGKTITSPYRIKHYGYVYPEIIFRRNKNIARVGKKYSDRGKTMWCNPIEKVKLEKFNENANLFLEKIKWDIIARLETYAKLRNNH